MTRLSGTTGAAPPRPLSRRGPARGGKNGQRDRGNRQERVIFLQVFWYYSRHLLDESDAHKAQTPKIITGALQPQREEERGTDACTAVRVGDEQENMSPRTTMQMSRQHFSPKILIADAGALRHLAAIPIPRGKTGQGFAEPRLEPRKPCQRLGCWCWCWYFAAKPDSSIEGGC